MRSPGSSGDGGGWHEVMVDAGGALGWLGLGGLGLGAWG